MNSDIKLGQQVKILSDDIIVFKSIVTEDNIEKIKQYIQDGYRYCIK